MARPKVKSQIVAGRQARVVKVTPGPAAFRSCKPSSAGASFRRVIPRTTQILCPRYRRDIRTC